jgi:polysaccharide biosynthesis transport protein
MAATNDSMPQNLNNEPAADTGLLKMSEPHLAPSYGPAYPQSMPQEGVERGLLAYWQIVCRKRGILLVGLLAGLFSGTVVTLCQEPTYIARTSLEFQPRSNANLLRADGVEQAFDESAIVTYQHVLRSRSLSQRVVQRLKAQAPLQHGNVPQSSSLLLQGMEKMGLNIGVARHVRGYNSALEQAAMTLKARAIPQTRIVEISCESTVPSVAAAFDNALVNEFIDEDLQSHWNSTQSTNKQLMGELQQLRTRMEESERALNDYAEKSGIMFTSTNATLLDDKLKMTQQELARAENDRVAREAIYKVAQASPPEAVAAILADPLLQHYQGELADLKRQLAEVSSTFTPTYFKVKAIQAQISEVEGASAKEATGALQRLKNDYEEAVHREAIFATTYHQHVNAATSEARRVLQYGTLKNEFDANRQLYENVSRRVKELDITSAVHTSNIRVIDTAEPPATPDRPSPIKNLGMGLFGGVAFGIGLVFWKEYISATIWRPGESSTLLNIPELGVIPSSVSPYDQSRISVASRSMLNPIRDLWSANVKERPSSVELVSWPHQTSSAAECFGRTVASILFSKDRASNPAWNRGAFPKLVVVTSPAQGDGKSTVCGNLAIGFAEIKLRVLVVDCDLRKPTLHKFFDVANTWGISNILSESTDIDTLPIEAVCRETKFPGLHILTSGPPVDSVSQLLFSARLTKLMLRCRQEFDMVLVDTPPVLPVPDARALSRHSDGAILVLRAGHSKVKAAIASTQVLMQDGSRIFGTILNDWNPSGSIGEHVYDYYESPHAARY